MNATSSHANPRLVPSLMCMSMLDVRADIGTLEDFFEEVHIDIMDGHFCQSIHLSPSFVRDVRSIWKGNIEVHLMVDQPGAYFAELVSAGANSILFHLEAVPTTAYRALTEVRRTGVKVGIAICPSTPVQSLDDLLPQVDGVTILGVDPGYIGQELLPATLKRVQYVTEARKSQGLNYDICVDGGVRWENWRELVASGANRLVVGRSALFDRGPTVRDACLAAVTAFHA